MRTVKSRGPDTPTLVSALMRKHHALRWPTSPAHRGEREAAVKTIRAGNAGMSRLNLWYLPPAFFFAGGPWGRPAPGIPRALCPSRAVHRAKPRTQDAPREGELMSHSRHCEEPKATKQSRVAHTILDCFASLPMTSEQASDATCAARRRRRIRQQRKCHPPCSSRAGSAPHPRAGVRAQIRAGWDAVAASIGGRWRRNAAQAKPSTTITQAAAISVGCLPAWPMPKP
jgi:hypothetical protein